MKKPLTVLVLFVYMVPLSLFLTFYQIFTKGMKDSFELAIFTIPLLLMIAVCILVAVNIMAAVHSIVRAQDLLFRTVMIFKLCLIPFYIVNFACWMIASMVFHIAIIIWPMIPFIIAYTYFTLLGTSAYIIAKLFSLRKSKIITTKQFVLHGILQIIFAVDVIDTIYLAIKQKSFNEY
ncbi:hypothetical protein [Lutispora saccharofermentans]|uniref:Uncharacterized protein n=1 Tax=Lutispora saccharofermentans TaxID=3024236 RepID=A0ABT1NLC9_9FIRM|nr:hypothetical protein [Lutispora saccharofermentans]MCQ1530716.1 hypothetical protein [Lutispora saccharofermentans]